MRKSWLFALGAVASLSLGSCSSLTKTAQYTPVDLEIHSAAMADLDVRKEKVTKSADWSWNPLKPFSVEEGKRNVMAELLQEQNADVLIEPQFIIKRRGFMRGGTVTVAGFPANFTGFHKMTVEEAQILNPEKQKVVSAPVTASSHLLAAPVKAKKRSRISDPTRRYNMINILGGWIPKEDDGGIKMGGGQWGIMYGNYKNHWGWYVKAFVPYAQVKKGHGFKESEYTGSFNLTAGAIWRPSNDWSIHFGTGYATVFEPYGTNNGKGHVSAEPGFPIDLGVNWNCVGPLNVMAGFQAVTPYDSGYSSVNPYLGVGVTF